MAPCTGTFSSTVAVPSGTYLRGGALSTSPFVAEAQTAITMRAGAAGAVFAVEHGEGVHFRDLAVYGVQRAGRARRAGLPLH